MSRVPVAKESLVIDHLITELLSNGRYVRFERNKPYQIMTNGTFYAGELDLLAHRVDGSEVYFEVKHSFNDRSWKKAKQQFSNYKKAHPWKRVHCVFVSPELTRLYHA